MFRPIFFKCAKKLYSNFWLFVNKLIEKLMSQNLQLQNQGQTLKKMLINLRKLFF